MTGETRPRIFLGIRDHVIDGGSDRVAQLYDRIQRLDADGTVDDVVVEVYGTRLPTPDDSPVDALARPMWERYRAFEAWATRQGYSLEPAFERRRTGSLVRDERTEVVLMPVVCLAVYVGDDVRSVVPCTTGDGVRTVDDCLAAFESGEWAPPEREATTEVLR
jgi:hypothetical protein